MTTLVRCALLALPAAAAAATLPQVYSFTATSNMMGPMTVTVHRNGARERIELAGAPGGFHVRVLYDFQAHRIYTVDLNAGGCTTQEYTSPYAPSLHDPIGGAEEMAREAGALRTIGRETVNGAAARVVEAPIGEGRQKMKLWLEEKFGFPVKQTMIGDQGEQLLFEMRQLSYAAPAAALFAQPTGCKAVGGSTNANGGSAEFTVGQSAAGEASGGAPLPGGSVLLGKWEFHGKDGAGVEWNGELTVEKLPADSFEASKYTNLCDLNLSSGNAGKGMSGPCRYDPATRKATFEGGGDGASRFSLTAVLSADGKSLAQGRWTDAAPAAGAWSASKATGQSKR